MKQKYNQPKTRARPGSAISELATKTMTTQSELSHNSGLSFGRTNQRGFSDDHYAAFSASSNK